MRVQHYGTRLPIFWHLYPGLFDSIDSILGSFVLKQMLQSQFNVYVFLNVLIVTLTYES